MNPQEKPSGINTRNYDTPQHRSVIEMLELAGIKDVSPEKVDKLVSGEGVDPRDQVFITTLLDNWKHAVSPIDKKFIANEFVGVVTNGKYLQSK